MKLKIATINDIDATLKLHYKYQVDTIKEEDKADGFVTTPFTKEELTQLVEQEQGLFIAKDGDEVVAYVMSASWDFWSRWPMFEFMVGNLDGKRYNGVEINANNSYQYGPVCVDKRYRGSGLLEEIFEFAKSHMSQKYDILITFVNKINPRSYQAHSRKLKLDILSEFEYNSSHYWEFAMDIS